jgi:hypothetical protein
MTQELKSKRREPVARVRKAVMMSLGFLCVMPTVAGAQQRMPPPPPPSAELAAVRAEQAAEPEYKSSDAQFAALKAKAQSTGKIGWAQLPDWSGVWESLWVDRIDGVKTSTDYTPMPLTQEAKKKYDPFYEHVKDGSASDPITACLPAGFPRTLTVPFYTEFLLTPGRSVQFTEIQSEARRIYTDGRGHVPEDRAYPLWSGDSIGFWDGDKLVVHSNHLREYSSGFYRFGPPMSDQATVVEEIRRVSQNEILDKVTIYDPVNLTRPYRTVQGWRLVTTPDARVDTWSCEENSSAAINPDGSTKLVLPTEVSADSKRN